jgi:hypothetical protein
MQTCDLLLVSSYSTSSFMIRKKSGSEYSHIGIIVERDGALWFAHLSPEDDSGLVPLGEYLAHRDRRRVTALRYRALDATARFAVTEFALANALASPFDKKYTFGGDSAMYCTEFVYRAYAAGGVPLFGGAPPLKSYSFSLPPMLSPQAFIDSHEFDRVVPSRATTRQIITRGE